MFEVIPHIKVFAELKKFPPDMRGRMQALIDDLKKYGHLMQMPHSKALGSGLFELRVGKRDIGRCLYSFVYKNKIYLLCAFIKKTQQTPSNIIKIAKERLKDMTNE